MKEGNKIKKNKNKMSDVVNTLIDLFWLGQIQVFSFLAFWFGSSNMFEVMICESVVLQSLPKSVGFEK